MITRWHDAAEIASVLGPYEPLTTPIVASVAARGTRRGIRVWRMGDSHAPAAVLCSTRVCRDRWVAYVHETEPGAARAFTWHLNHGPARRVCGSTPTLQRLLGDLAAVSSVTVLPYLAIPPPIPLMGDPEPNGRPATMADLDRLVELFCGERLEVAPTVPRLRKILTQAVRAGDAFVLEADGQVVGTMRFDHRTEAYAWIAALVVDPTARGRGLSWRLLEVGTHHLAGLGLGTAMTLARSNPMRPRPAMRERFLEQRPDIAANVQPWIDDPGGDDVPAWSIVRFRGRPLPKLVRRVARALEVVEGPISG